MKPLLENWVKQLEEELEDYKHSFEVRDELTPEIWENNQLKPEVLQVLREISKDFFEGLELGQIDIKDIILTGSLANYNWSEYSDVDLHILVDFAEVDENVKLVKDFFDAKKGVWNSKHDILVMGYEVEIYVQDINEPHKASGQYSVMNDSWNVEPSKMWDWDTLREKIKNFFNKLGKNIKQHSKNSLYIEYLSNLILEFINCNSTMTNFILYIRRHFCQRHI